MRRAIFLVVLLLAMSIPYVQADSEEGVLFTWSGNASTVELVGEWDWDSPTTMTEVDGLWSASIELSEGLYCYKFIVDSNLDAELRHQMRGEIRRLHEAMGCTTIYVTHDQIEAMTLADRIAILDKGELQQHCPPMEAYNNPANDFVKGFLVKHLNDIKETADTLFKS